jgi:hypothetical protein
MKLEDATFLTEEQKENIRAFAQNFTSENVKAMRKMLESYEEMQIKSVVYTIFIAISFVVAYFYRFDPTFEYNAWNGEWHMFIMVPKWVLSFFVEGITCRPPLYDNGYVVGWWIGLVTMAILYGCYFFYLFLLLYLFPKVKKARVCMNVIDTYELFPPDAPDQPEQSDHQEQSD